MSTEAMKNVLTFLRGGHFTYPTSLATDLEQAIAEAEKQEPEQEPVATVTSETGDPDIAMSWWHEPALPVGTPLYTTPPQRTWVGLTPEDMPDGNNPMFDTDEFALGAAWAQAKLKEKNT